MLKPLGAQLEISIHLNLLLTVGLGKGLSGTTTVVETNSFEPAHAPAPEPESEREPAVPDPAPQLAIPPQPIDTPRRPPAVQAQAKLTCADLKADIETACKIDFQIMFGCFGGREDPMEPRAYLLFHPEIHKEEMELMTRWLLMHHVEVGSMWVSGSWQHFVQETRQGRSGVVIVSKSPVTLSI